MRSGLLCGEGKLVTERYKEFVWFSRRLLLQLFDDRRWGDAECFGQFEDGGECRLTFTAFE